MSDEFVAVQVRTRLKRRHLEKSFGRRLLGDQRLHVSPQVGVSRARVIEIHRSLGGLTSSPRGRSARYVASAPGSSASRFLWRSGFQLADQPQLRHPPVAHHGFGRHTSASAVSSTLSPPK